MSRIFAAGVKATAIANIKTDVATFISFDTNGRKVLDVDGLVQYLETQFAAISTDVEYISPATAATAAAAGRGVSTKTLATSLNTQIGPDHWSARPDWPTTTSVLAGSALVAAVKAAIAECKRASDRITNFFTSVNDKLTTRFNEYYLQQNIDAAVPLGVQRLLENRAYIHTFVTDRGEESAPSAASVLFELDQNDTVTVTPAAAPGGRNIATCRFYRSNSSNTGASFQFVAENAAGTPYTDIKKNAELQEPTPTTTWDEPPANLQGMVDLWNGGIAGFYGNTVALCENYVPYAWPVEYRITTVHPIVGLGTFGNVLVALTRGKPMFIGGQDASSMQDLKIESNQACVARRSIAAVEGGLLYASPDGLCLASLNGVRVITGPKGFNVFDRPTWQALAPSTIFGAVQDNVYIFWTNSGAACYALDLENGKLVTVTRSASAVYQDLLSDRLYVTTGTTIQELFSAATKRTATWRGRRDVADRPANLGWVQVLSDFEAPVTVNLYRDGALTDAKVLTSNAADRFQSLRVKEHEIEVVSTANLTTVTATSSTDELKSL